MPKTPAIFGISMTSQKSRRWLIVVCYAVCCLSIGLPYIPSSRTALFFWGFIIAWWICIAAVFNKLAKDAVAPMQEDSRAIISLGLLHNALPAEYRPDERIISVRNAAYYRAYRIVVAICSLWIPALYWVTILNEALLWIIAGSLYAMIFTLPQSIILWTEADIPEEAI